MGGYLRNRTGLPRHARQLGSVPDVTSISPSTDTTSGGATITVTGTGFTAGSIVLCGGTARTTTYVSATSLTFVAPAHSAASVDIAVQNGGWGTSDTLSSALQFVAPPSAGVISGTVSIFGGAALANAGKVQLYNSSGVSQEIVSIDGSGNYEFAAVADGTYYVMLHPINSHVLHAGDTGSDGADYDDQPSVVVAGDSPTHDFDVDVAWFADDFSGYANTAALKNLSTGFGGSSRSLKFTASSTSYWDGSSDVANTTQTLNATGGPNGGKCYQHDILSSAFTGGTLGPFGNWSQATTFTTLYLRWVDWHSSAWNAPIEYKVWLNSMVNDANNANGQGPHFEYQGSTTMRYQQTDDSPGTTVDSFAVAPAAYCIYPPGTTNSCKVAATLRSTWNVWVVELTDIGLSTHTIKVYLNGVYKDAIQGNQTKLVAPGKLRTGQPLGANYNTGTYAAQTRRVAAVAVSATRPALIDVTP